MTLQLHKPDEHGVLKPEPGAPPDYREQLSSPRWGLAAKGGRLPALKNLEMRPTSRAVAVLFWVSLAALTFALLVAGYGIGVWHFPAP